MNCPLAQLQPWVLFRIVVPFDTVVAVGISQFEVARFKSITGSLVCTAFVLLNTTSFSKFGVRNSMVKSRSSLQQPFRWVENTGVSLVGLLGPLEIKPFSPQHDTAPHTRSFNNLDFPEPTFKFQLFKWGIPGII